MPYVFLRSFFTTNFSKNYHMETPTETGPRNPASFKVMGCLVALCSASMVIEDSPGNNWQRCPGSKTPGSFPWVFGDLPQWPYTKNILVCIYIYISVFQVFIYILSIYTHHKKVSYNSKHGSSITKHTTKTSCSCQVVLFKGPCSMRPRTRRPLPALVAKDSKRSTSNAPDLDFC